MEKKQPSEFDNLREEIVALIREEPDKPILAKDLTPILDLLLMVHRKED